MGIWRYFLLFTSYTFILPVHGSSINFNSTAHLGSLSSLSKSNITEELNSSLSSVEHKFSDRALRPAENIDENADKSENPNGKTFNTSTIERDFEIQRKKLEWLTGTVRKLVHRVRDLEMNNPSAALGTPEFIGPDILEQDLAEYSDAAATCEGPRRHLVGQSCYSLPLFTHTRELSTWWDSRFLCKRHLGRDADLVAVESPEEFRNIQYLLQTHFGGLEEIWFGASNLSSSWRWVSNDLPLTSSFIDSSEENDFASKNLATKYSVIFNQNHEKGENNQKRTTASLLPDNPRCLSLLQDFTLAAEPCYFKRFPLCELNIRKT